MANLYNQPLGQQNLGGTLQPYPGFQSDFDPAAYISAGIFDSDQPDYDGAQQYWRQQYESLMGAMEGGDLQNHANYLYGKIDAGQPITEEEQRLLYRSIPPINLQPIVGTGIQEASAAGDPAATPQAPAAAPAPQQTGPGYTIEDGRIKFAPFNPTPGLTREDLAGWANVPAPKLVPITGTNPPADPSAPAAPVAATPSAEPAGAPLTAAGAKAQKPLASYLEYKEGKPKPTFERRVGNVYAYGGVDKDTGAYRLQDPVLAANSPKSQEMAAYLNLRGMATAAQNDRDIGAIMRSGNKDDPFNQMVARHNYKLGMYDYMLDQSRKLNTANSLMTSESHGANLDASKAMIPGLVEQWKVANPRMQGQPGFDTPDDEYERMAQAFALQQSRDWALGQTMSGYKSQPTMRSDPNMFRHGFGIKNGVGVGDAAMRSYNEFKPGRIVSRAANPPKAPNTVLRSQERDGFHGDMSD